MSSADDAEAYLRRVGHAVRERFKGGFVTAPILLDDGVVPVIVDLRAADRAPALPMKKKTAKRRRDSDDDDETELGRAEAPHTSTPAPSALSTSPSTSAVPTATSNTAPSTTNPTKRLSLLEKYFPGNLLKNSSLELALSPSVPFVEKTVSTVSAMRERVVLLRSVADDVEELLTGEPIAERVDDDGRHLVADAAAVAKQVCPDNWKGVRDLMEDATRHKAGSAASLRRQLEQMCRRKAAIRMPAAHWEKLWYEYLDANGPESGQVLTLSDVVWTSSACTTLLFTLLIRRLLRTVRQCEDMAKSLGRLDVVHSGDASDSAAVAGSSTVTDHCAVFVSHQPPLSASLSPEAASLLVFLRCLMPTTAPPTTTERGNSEVLAPSGYGVWLFTCLCAVDTPLDPHTDRLAHELFRHCCDHLRTIGTVANVRGDERGELWEKLGAANDDYASPSEAAAPKTYASLEDVGREELRALGTIIVVLSKFFRQNQNRLITL